MKNRKQLGVGLFTGMIIGIIADNLVMGIGIGLAIESKGQGSCQRNAGS